MFKQLYALWAALSWSNEFSEAAIIPTKLASHRRRRTNPVLASIRGLIYRHIWVPKLQRRIQTEPRAADDLKTYLQSHVCLHPFERLDATHTGLAYVCCERWLPTPIGNLFSDLLPQWSGVTAKKIRESVVDGSYRYCSHINCQQISNRLLPRRDSEEVKETLKSFEDKEPPPPRFVGLMHDISCNLSCPSCRTGLIVADRKKQDQLDRQFDRAILPLLYSAETIYFGGAGDAFGSSHFRRVIKRLDRHEFPNLQINLHTNGQLFDERAWIELGLGGKRVKNCQISVDAAAPETYAIVRRGGSFDQLLKNLQFIKSLRVSGEIASLEFSMVVQAQNFREMAGLVRLAQEFSADAVWFQMIRNWGTFTPEEFKQVFIGHRDHPDHQELIEVLRAPELSLPIAKIGNIEAFCRDEMFSH